MNRIKTMSWLLLILSMCLLVACGQQTDDAAAVIDNQFDEITIPELQAMMQAGELTSLQLVDYYIERIAQIDPLLNSILEINDSADRPRSGYALPHRHGLVSPRGPVGDHLAAHRMLRRR